MLSRTFFSFASTVLFALLYIPVRADTFQAFTGDTCDGDQGNVVNCDDSCHSFDGRHSFIVVGGGSHCVTFFENDGCALGTEFDFSPEGNGECIHVDTGTSIGSFICSSTNTCDL